VHVRVTAASFLKVAVRYLAGEHEVTLPAGSFERPASNFQTRPAFVREIGGALHPTLTPVEHLHLWLTLGITWGKIVVAPIELDPPGGSVIRERSGVFVATPFGAGAAYDVWPGWVTLSLDGAYAPAFSQSGALYDREGFVDRSGQPAVVGAMPQLSGSFYAIGGLSLSL
jgi:hypothetical protein